MHYDPQLAEHIPELTPNLRTARHFLEWIAPSPDDPERPAPNERCDELPALRSTHTFIVKDDAIIDLKPRADTSLNKTVVGTFDEWAKKLGETNTHYRAGIFVQLDARAAIVAEHQGLPEIGRGVQVGAHEALPLTPSIRLLTGSSTETWIWLLTDGHKLSLSDRGAIGQVLASRHGGTVLVQQTTLVRIPGYYSRAGRPFMVQAQLGKDERGLLRATRFTADQLRAAFGLKPEPVTTEKPIMRIPISEFQQAGVIDTATVPAIVGEARTVLIEPYAAEFAIFKAFPVSPSLAVTKGGSAHLVWLIDTELSNERHAAIARRLKKLGVDVAPKGERVVLPQDATWRGNYDQGDAAGVHHVGDLVNAFA